MDANKVKAVVLLADGFEEVEAITPVDLLRRAGIQVDVVGVSNRDVIGSHGIRLTTDITLDEMEDSKLPDVIILPGGMPGTTNLASDADVEHLLRRQAQDGRLIAAICAAPVLVLGAKGLLKGRRFTCFPGLESHPHDGKWEDARVVCDGSLITSRGPGSAAEFSIAIIRHFLGNQAAEDVRRTTQQLEF